MQSCSVKICYIYNRFPAGIYNTSLTMRIRFILFLLLLLTLVFPFNIQAQDITVTRSAHIETYKGKTYYFHFVEEGQTISDIAKAYEVSTQDIIKENPLAEKGLKPDMILRIPQNTGSAKPDVIPVVEKSKEPETKAPVNKVKEPEKTGPVEIDKNPAPAIVKSGTAVPVNQEPEYLLYLVKKQETLYGISKQFNVTVDDIMNANPGFKGLKSGQKIKIPVKKAPSKPQANLPQAPKVNMQESLPDEIEVKTGETLYSISKQYKVTVDDLIDLNPQLSGGLKAGMVIKLKKSKAVKAETVITKPEQTEIIPEKVETKPEKVEVKPDKTEVKPDRTEIIPEKTEPKTEKSSFIINTNAGKCFKAENLKKTWQVALLLPFVLDESTDLFDASEDKSPSGFENFNYFQFYAGFMLAADSLEKCGLHARIQVIDAEKFNDTLTIRQTLRKPGLEKMDLLVGPLYAPSFTIAERFALKNEIGIVNPLSRREGIVEGNPYVIKAQTSGFGAANKLFLYISAKYPDANIIMVRNDNKEFKTLADAFRTAVNEGISDKSFLGTLQETVYSIDFMAGVTKNLKAGAKNFVIMFSNNKTTVPNFVSLLNPYAKSNDLILVGMDGWDELDLETEFLVNLNYHQLSSEYIDFESEAAKQFIASFRNKYGAVPLPSKYAYLGYDIGWYFLTSLMWYGDNYLSCIPGNQGKGLQYNFDFYSLKPGDGLQNNNISIIKLQDYKMILAE